MNCAEDEGYLHYLELTVAAGGFKTDQEVVERFPLHTIYETFGIPYTPHYYTYTTDTGDVHLTDGEQILLVGSSEVPVELYNRHCTTTKGILYPVMKAINPDWDEVVKRWTAKSIFEDPARQTSSPTAL